MHQVRWETLIYHFRRIHHKISRACYPDSGKISSPGIPETDIGDNQEAYGRRLWKGTGETSWPCGMGRLDPCFDGILCPTCSTLKEEISSLFHHGSIRFAAFFTQNKLFSIFFYLFINS